MKCPLCDKGRLIKKKSPYMYGDIYFGEYESDVCSTCREVIFTEKSFDDIEAKAKELGVWGLVHKTKISYSGNSLMVRIPKDIAKFLGMKKGKAAMVAIGGKKRLVVEVA